MLLRLLGLWVLWRIARVVLPLLIALVLLGELSASIDRRPLISPPHSLSPITTVIRRHRAGLIAHACRGLTRALQAWPR
ncbi:MAG: hypothetical protein ACR2NR_23265 [Solirubrobacteraceae bacterium]